jgi:predicted esterase
MKRSLHVCSEATARVIGSLLLVVFSAATAAPTEVLLKDGRVLRGRVGETVGLAEQNGGEGNALKQIVFVNDDFRMTFVSRRQIAAIRPDTTLEDAEKFECIQPFVAKNGRQKVMAVGPPAGPLKDFDDWGRRIYPMRTAGGIQNVEQVITELTPQYAKVEGVRVQWDMRIATSTLSDKKLEAILMNQIDPKRLDHRKKVIRFFLQCKRYRMAVDALQQTIKDFSNDTQVAQDLEPTLKKIRQMYAQQTLDELGLRRENGQHGLVQKYLDHFPTEDVPGEILQTISEVKREYRAFEAKRTEIENAWRALMPQVEHAADRAALAAALQEIGPGLTPEMLPRMAAFLQNQNAPLKADEKLSLAVSGWVLGSDAALTDLPMTLSAWKLRGLVQNYLTEPVKVRRDRQLHSILSELAAKPEVLAAMAAHMAPPYSLPDLIDEDIPGYSKVQTEAIPGQPDATYYVQLPPEYNPHRRYPMVVSLHGMGHDPTLQIDWWAGPNPHEEPGATRPGGPRGRQGQAGRYGYIVIAPEWTVKDQQAYEYSAHEQSVVLGCFRDACRRFAVDTDRVFLSGHFDGGDAAWDIGLAHPDLWAGVIPISAEVKKSCPVEFYTENARLVPLYVVLGELDGGKIARDATVLDRYLQRGYNATVVEYLGRGHEHFVDEQLPLFDWMNRCKRSFPLPRDREFACSTMRSCDHRFWWAEVENLPPNAVVSSWPPPRGKLALLVKGNSPTSNTLVLTAGNSPATIWLAPEMVNFNARVNISIGGRRAAGVPAMIKPSGETLLEDLRVRGDRQHPFWAKVEAR